MVHSSLLLWPLRSYMPLIAPYKLSSSILALALIPAQGRNLATRSVKPVVLGLGFF